jgi:hypothetical protein
MFAEQGKHSVVGHDRRLLVEQMVFQRTPVQTQCLEEKPVRVVLGKAHLADCVRHIQAEVLDKPGCGDKAVQQRRGSKLTLDLVIKARPGTGVAGQRGQHTLG